MRHPRRLPSTPKRDHIIAPCLNIEHHAAILSAYIMDGLALAANGDNFLSTRSPQLVLAIHHRMQHRSGCLSFLPSQVNSQPATCATANAVSTGTRVREAGQQAD